MSMFSAIADGVNGIDLKESLAPLADVQGVLNASQLQDIMGQLHIDATTDVLQALPMTEALPDTTIHADAVPETLPDSLDALQSSGQLQEVLQQLNTVLQDQHDAQIHIIDNLHASADSDDSVVVAHADNDVAPAHDDVSAVHDDASAA